MLRCIPHRSPYGLIQEDLWPDEWKILTACLMLNCTSRKQIERVLPAFFLKWPTPQAIIDADAEELKRAIEPLGFKNRRSQRLLELAKAYIKKDWVHANELPGVGDYAGRAWEIFCRNVLGDLPPKDGALTAYWHWRKGLK